jgi:radical SAM superfamily enzyme YgiQ (UPF0313 family)
MTPPYTALKIARLLKLASPDRKIVMGGAHATMLTQETMASGPEIDIVVRGEGDESVLAVMQALEGNLPLDGIAGISYRAEGKIVHAAERVSGVDMDALPFAAYHLLPWKMYRPHPPHGMSLPFAAVVTSRGCPYRCAYCCKPVFGSKFRAQSPARVVDELAYLKDRFGVKEMAFYDDSFTLDKKRVNAIAGESDLGTKITWTRDQVSLVDKELLINMKRALLRRRLRHRDRLA